MFDMWKNDVLEEVRSSDSFFNEVPCPESGRHSLVGGAVDC